MRLCQCSTKDAFIYLKGFLKAANILWAGACVCTFYIIYLRHADSTCDQHIALFLLVSANLSAFLAFLLILLRVMPDHFTHVRPSSSSGQLHMQKSQFINGLLFFGLVFFIIWFAIGNYWTFETNTTNCEPELYFVSLLYIITVYCWVALHFLVTMFVVVCFPDVAAQASADNEDDAIEDEAFAEARRAQRELELLAVRKHKARVARQARMINEIQAASASSPNDVVLVVDPAQLSRPERAMYEQRAARAAMQSKYLTIN
eukprot:TRINITY_DN60294_c0_g1_i2.p1 TRINITY_DN60294_c0_g1~~TRINITY_DN60294_c0_g1_i2.p1  ORF type:complete len:260 (-),score=99.21 TRINITY_DN60294_c0_g1_i2:22-801(-)